MPLAPLLCDAAGLLELPTAFIGSRYMQYMFLVTPTILTKCLQTLNVSCVN